MKHCKKCAMPNTRPGSIFNEDGICQACINYNKRREVNWEQRKKELRELCDKYRKQDGSYDCIIPVSGGKDSYFLTHILVNEMNMHPLLVTVTDSFTHTDAGSYNLRNLIETFKLNHYQYTINHDLFRRATKIAFEETGEALKFVEYAIYTVPTLLAQKFNIPFVVFGENSAYEYGTVKENFYLATPVVKGISDQLEKDRQWWIENGLTNQEVNSIKLDEKKLLPEVIYMGYFYPWSSMTNLAVARRYGFKDLMHEWQREGYIENFEQIDSVAYLVHLWLKYPKFGFQRISDIASRRVREGLLSLEDAKKLITENDYKLDRKAMEDFINFLGYTAKQFWDTTEKFWNKDIFEKDENGEWKFKKDLIDYKTEQSLRWAGDFGNKYIDRNPGNSEELDNLYLKNFGVSRTSLNKYFLNDIPLSNNILEIGCNKGPQLDSLQKMGFQNLNGIDISEKALEIAKLQLPKVNFFKSSASDLPFKDNSFDLIFTSGVLIHINPNDLSKVIDEIYRVSKKYIFCYEYFSENCEEIEYRGNKNLLWKNNFMKLFLDRYPNLKIVNQKKLDYLDNSNVDHIFLLEK